MPSPRAIPCLTPKCGGIASASYKNLCMKCYINAKRLVDGGQTTWEELAALGLAQKELSPFEAEFLKRKSDASGSNQAEDA